MFSNKKTTKMANSNDSSRRLIVVVAVAVGLACGAGTVRADFTFGEPTLFDEPVNSPGPEYFAGISADGLELYVEMTFEATFPALDWDLYVSTRETTADAWSVPVSLGPAVNSDHTDICACLSEDGLELYFASNRPDGHGSYDIWVATRPTRSDPWATAVNLGPTINSAHQDSTPWITPDGLELYLSSKRPGGYGLYDIWVATRASTNDAWGEPTNLGTPVNSAASDCVGCLSSDGLVLLFCDNEWLGELRPGGQGLTDTWMTRRKSTADPWEPPVNLGKGMNSNCWDLQPRISPDGSVLYFTSSRPDSAVLTVKRDIWQAPIIRIVDFNGDGQVDGADVCTMVDHWGTDDSVCDIGPMPWGDGIVDVADVKILAGYIGEEVVDPTLIAHWAFDETEGTVAQDGVGDSDGTVTGYVGWQPDAGKVGGALAFDGTTLVTTDFVLDPGAAPFSVLVWVKNGLPGQVVVSQQGGANWLTTDPATGALLTELCGGRQGGTLYSDAIVITDDWHRVGLAWDGSNRSLYVDDVLVPKQACCSVLG